MGFFAHSSKHRNTVPIACAKRCEQTHPPISPRTVEQIYYWRAKPASIGKLEPWPLNPLRARATAHATTDNTEYSLKLPLFGVTWGSLSPGTMDLAWDKPFLGEAELSGLRRRGNRASNTVAGSKWKSGGLAMTSICECGNGNCTSSTAQVAKNRKHMNPVEHNNYCLVVLTILKNMKVSWEGLSHIYPYIMENKKCSKPPISNPIPIWGPAAPSHSGLLGSSMFSLSLEHGGLDDGFGNCRRKNQWHPIHSNLCICNIYIYKYIIYTHTYIYICTFL